MGQGYHILLVDDEDFILTAGSAMLDMLGNTVTTAEGGEAALEAYREKGDAIDAVIVDLSMPDMDGGECFRALRDINPDVKVFLTSGYLMDATIRGLLDEGMVGMIQKPFSLDGLRSSLDAVLA